MNKIGYQPLPVLLRAEPNDARGSSNSAKILRVVAAMGTVLAFGGVIVVCLIAFDAFPLGKPGSKAPDSTPPTPSVSANAAANQDAGANTVQPDPNQATRGTAAEDHSLIDQTSAATLNPPSTPAPLPKPEATMSDSQLLQGERPETAAKAPEKHLSETAPKNL
jgi:hypothetical protein